MITRQPCPWLAVAGAVLLHGAASAADLSVCIDTSSATAARDQSLAEAVAARTGLHLAVTHFDGAQDDDGMTAKTFKPLLAKQCQMVMGFPMDAASDSAPDGLLATRPYDQTGFVLVVPHASPARKLADLPQGTEVAITYGTAPGLYFGAHPGLQPDIHGSDGETLQTVASGVVKAAMVWGPTASGYNEAAVESTRLGVYPLAEPHARWNVVGLYLPAGAHQAAAFDAAVAALKNPAVQHAALTTEAPASALPALYTEAQAKAGAAKFSDNCEQCHGAKLEGRAGPALKGPNFASTKSAFTVSDIFNIVSQNMPASNPGSLDHGDYVQIMAFLLQQNGYPAGAKELTFDGASASKASLVYQGK